MKKVLLAVLTLIPCLAMAAPGAYVSANAGVNATDPSASAGGLSWNTATGFAGSVGAGYLWGDSSFDYGLEVDGSFSPNSTGSISGAGGVNTQFKDVALSLLGVLKFISCSTGFDAFVKGGGAYVMQSYALQAGGVTSGSVSGDDLLPEAALGLGYQFNQNVEVDLTADAIFGSSGSSWLSSVGTSNQKVAQYGDLMLGLTYTFA